MSLARKISFDIEEKALKKLDKVAEIADRPRAYILNELVSDFIDELEGYYVASARLKKTALSKYVTLDEARKLVQQKREQKDKE